jgi:hypothetical protein
MRGAAADGGTVVRTGAVDGGATAGVEDRTAVGGAAAGATVVRTAAVAGGANAGVEDRTAVGGAAAGGATVARTAAVAGGATAGVEDGETAGPLASSPGRGTGTTAEGGAEFRLRVMALPGVCDGAVWASPGPAITRTDRRRTCDMAGTIASQPMNGKLLST